MRGLAVALALTLIAQDDGVHYDARVDDKNQAWVDVRNTTLRAIRVTAVTVSFFDASDHLQRRITLDCDEDCGVASSALESFGPIAGPPEWQTVRAMEVLFDSETPASDPPRPSATPSPPGRVGGPAVDPSAPEAVLRAFYVALNLGNLTKAKELCTRSGYESLLVAAGAGGFEAWAKRETMDGTVVDMRLLESLNQASGTARVEIAFADVTPARRRVSFKREGGSWKIDRVEPAS